MPTPREGYYTRDGKRVPGTTTITGRFKDSGGLIGWANKIAREPLMQARRLASSSDTVPDLVRFLIEADPDTWDSKKSAQKAADAGTCAHDMFDCWIRGVDFASGLYSESTLKLAEPAYLAAYEWATQSKLQVVETEVQLVSERYRFGGTRDAILVSGKRAIGDWKTSSGVWPEMLCQLAAYGILDEENTGKPIDGGYHLLKFSKQESADDPVRFSHHYWSQLDVAREAFIVMRNLYDLMARVGKMV